MDLGVVISASHNSYQDTASRFFGRGEKFGEEVERAIEPSSPTTRGVSLVRRSAHRYGRLIAEYWRTPRSWLPQRCVRGMRVAWTWQTVLPRPRQRVCSSPWDGARELSAMLPMAATSQRLRIDSPGAARSRGRGAPVPAWCGVRGQCDSRDSVDHRGQILGRCVTAAAWCALPAAGRLTEAVVSTVMSTLGLELELRKRGISLCGLPSATSTSWKNAQERFVVGGEQSGHVILAEHLFTGDGMATALASCA